MLSFFTFVKDLTTIRKALLLALGLFVAGGAAGWAGTESLQGLLAGQLEGLREISQSLNASEQPQWNFFIFIFLNNSIKSVVIIFLGALFGILPALFLLINGAVIGYLIHISAIQGLDLYELIVKGLLPHGIIEIPAIIIACAFGIRFGGKVISDLFSSATRREQLSGSWPFFMRQTLTASVWVTLLLLIAAVIESTITFSLLS